MKHSIYDWKEVAANETFSVEKGWLRVRCSQAAPLYCEAFGVETLVGVDTAHSVQLSEAVNCRVDAPKGVRVFLFAPVVRSQEVESEQFTNLDRQPQENPQLQAVTAAMRQFEFQKRAFLQEVKRDWIARQPEVRVARGLPSEDALPDVLAVLE